MKIEILGRSIEIDDAEVMKVFEKKYEKHKNMDMDKEEFIEKVLDYYEYNFKYNIILALGHSMDSALSVLKDIAWYKFFEKVAPFNKPFCESNPGSLPLRGLSNHCLEFLNKLGLSENRDEDSVKNILEEEEKKKEVEREKARKKYEIEWGWLHNKNHEDK